MDLREKISSSNFGSVNKHAQNVNVVDKLNLCIVIFPQCQNVTVLIKNHIFWKRLLKVCKIA